MDSIFSMGIAEFLSTSLDLLSALFIFAVGVFLLIALVIYIKDSLQKESTILRNYPLIGRFRFLFEKMGEFFRQYFFAMDREELPFNRAQRSWVYRAAKNVDSTVAFGSTKDLRQPGAVIFVNCPFPKLASENVKLGPMMIGPYCDKPYSTSSVFNISGMSFGAISKPAVIALSRGAKKAGCWYNTGEGGLSPHHLEGGCDIVFQIGTAKYGVRDDKGNLSDEKLKQVAQHPEVKMFELKLSQGAKPGKGGILPGLKVSKEISDIRGIPQGQDSISPNRHPEINSPAELLGMVEHIRTTTGKPVGFKTVVSSWQWLHELCELINERGEESAPDFITVDGGDGGTGAAPMSLIDNVGLTLVEALPAVENVLITHQLRKRIRIIASGKRINPTEVAWALCAGADFVTSARGFMFALGCIQALQCNKNTCPTGITTHNKDLQRGLDPTNKTVRVANYQKNLSKEISIIAHSCGVAGPRRLNRTHARIVMADGLSIPLDELHPYPNVRESK
ncbi:MAG: FMN-binding glutamate synthase family protein [Cycloclasticus sp.]|jgi:glutamate synthase domain-containing protein 2